MWHSADMDTERLLSVQQFLFYESRLLDDRRYREWFNLFTDDCHYWMPNRFNRLGKTSGEEWEIEKELTGPDELALFDDGKAGLGQRIERLYSGMSGAEDPPSRTRHFISNIEAFDTENPDEVLAFSSFLTYRSRLEGLGGDQDLLAGRREDLLRRVEDKWMIVRRKIIPDAVVLEAQNLSIFF